MLDYDDSAFYYFSLAVLSFMLIPFWYYVFKTIYRGEIDLRWTGVNCETVWFQNLLKTKNKLAKKSTWTKALFTRIFFGAIMTYIWWLNYDMVSSITGLQSFDPYQILELDMMADEKAIRKQYRRMSLLKHPDKNPDDP
jgi:translocation protein SEC63